MTLIVPEYLQTKKYTAKRDRLTLAHGGPIQAGVWDATDYKAIQRAAGANMSVDVGAGFALVPANNTGNKGLYHIENDASVNVSLAASNATNPRIDMVYVQVDDSADGAAADDTPQFGVVTGTPTAGATLDNRTGAGTMPSNALLLADVLVGAAVTSITATNIRDRRPWARGATMVRRGDGAGDFTTTSAAYVDVTNGIITFESSGSPVLVVLHATLSISTQPVIVAHAITDDANNILVWQEMRALAAGAAYKYPGALTTIWDNPTPGRRSIKIRAKADGTNTLTVRNGTEGVWALSLMERPGAVMVGAGQ